MLVDDDNLTVIRDHIVFVALEDSLRFDRLVEVVHCSNVIWCVEVLQPEHFLNFFDALVT